MPIPHTPSGLSQLASRVTGGFRDLAERREHDAALATDSRLAADHALADARATSHGQPGCRFCRR
jgi:hypothetical protein